MGYYLNPPEKVEQIGYPLYGITSYEQAMSVAIDPHECLVALGDRGMFKFAGLCYSAREFQEFYGQRNSLISLKFFAVPKSAFPEYYCEEAIAAEGVPEQPQIVAVADAHMPSESIKAIPVTENFRDTRHFTLAQILNVTTGILCTKIGDVYELLDFMTGDSLMTHQLGRGSDQVRPYIFNRHPQLRGITADMVSGKEYKSKVEKLVKVYGNDFGLYPIADGEYVGQEPMSELVNMISKKDEDFPIG